MPEYMYENVRAWYGLSNITWGMCPSNVVVGDLDGHLSLFTRTIRRRPSIVLASTIDIALCEPSVKHCPADQHHSRVLHRKMALFPVSQILQIG